MWGARTLAVAAWVLLYAALVDRLDAADTPTVRTELEDIAAHLPCFDTTGLLYDRLQESRWLSEKDEATYRQYITDLMAMQATEEDLLPLLKHHDPKVRTLAMAKLMMNDDAKALPAIVALAHDPAPTFPNPQPDAPALAMSGVGPPPKDQTVGGIATAIGNFYLNAAGWRYGINGGGGESGFPGYWQAHKDHACCASWFLVQLMRATQGTSPIPAARVDKIRQVRARIGELREPDRDWTLLLLGPSWRLDSGDPDPRANVFISDDEIIKIGQRLGPDNLLLALQGRIPSDDPDLKPGGIAMPGMGSSSEAMQLFILHHAVELLPQKDADALLDQRSAERTRGNGLVSSWWTIAAARLQPARAALLLHNDLIFFAGPKRDWDFGYDQTDLGITLWQMGRSSEAEFLANWFYSDLSKKNGHITPDACSKFIDGVASTPTARNLLAKIVSDPRYTTMSAYATMSLAKAVNHWMAKPIVSGKEIYDLYGQPPQELVSRLLDRLHQSVASWRN
jgi:hypothetical protein